MSKYNLEIDINLNIFNLVICNYLDFANRNKKFVTDVCCIFKRNRMVLGFILGKEYGKIPTRNQIVFTNLPHLHH